jgi:dihydroxyacetone synthase
VKFGAYVVVEEADADVTLASCGTNLHYVVSAAELLKRRGIKARLVSAPSLDLFQLQDEDYRAAVFPLDGKPVISVEEYVATTWARYVTASVGMTSFGYSASNESNYQRFGVDAKGIESKVVAYLAKLQGRNARMAGWHQL